METDSYDVGGEVIARQAQVVSTVPNPDTAAVAQHRKVAR